MRKLAIPAILVMSLATVAVAQEAKKPASPAAKAEATLGGKKVTVDYSAPSMRGRKIMGGLVPLDKVWRTGANAATTLTTETDLMIGKVHVAAGKYTLFTIPGEKEWTLIINKQTGQWGTNHDAAQDLGRATMTVTALKTPVETFTIAIKGEGDKGTLTMSWESTSASVPLVAHSH